MQQDVHGLGFDPFRDAEEFRQHKRQKLRATTAGGRGGGRGGAVKGGLLGASQGKGSGAKRLGVLGGVDDEDVDGDEGCQQPKRRARGVAFGTGVLEETDTMGYMEDYVEDDMGEEDEGGGAGFSVGGGYGGRPQQQQRGGRGGGRGKGAAGAQALALTSKGFSYELVDSEEEEDEEERFQDKRCFRDIWYYWGVCFVPHCSCTLFPPMFFCTVYGTT